MNYRTRRTINRVYKIVLYCLSIFTVLPLIFILLYLLKLGFSAINFDIITKVSRPVGEPGGALNSIVGTIILSTLAVLIASPLSILSGILISEYPQNPLSKILEIWVKLISGIPSIVIGIVTYLWLVKPVGRYSALAGSISLAIMMIPNMVTSTAETMKMIPKEIREASLALGANYGQTMLKILIPVSLPGIISGLLTGVGRIAGETAPLLFTAFGNPYLSLNILKPMNTLSLLIYNYALSPYKEWHRIAWGAALILIFLAFTLNIISRRAIKRWTT